MEASPEKSLRLLLIDDDEDEYIVLKSLVAGVDRIHFEVDWVDSTEKALQIHPDAPYDVLLVDYRLGAVNGLDIVEEFVRRGLKTPIILLTGQGNYEIDEAAQQAGAADYLAKDGLNFSILERTIRYAMEHKNTQAELERRVQERTQALYQEMGERQQAQEATRLSEARFRALAETTSAAIFITREMIPALKERCRSTHKDLFDRMKARCDRGEAKATVAGNTHRTKTLIFMERWRRCVFGEDGVVQNKSAKTCFLPCFITSLVFLWRLGSSHLPDWYLSLN